MAAPEIEAVRYADPWAPLPPLGVQPGVTVFVTTAAPEGYVLAAQVLQGANPIGPGNVARSAKTKSVVVTPPAPLSEALAYTVEVQWAKQGTTPDWSDPTTIASAPVLAIPIRLLAGAVTPGQIALRWESGAPGGEAEIYEEPPGGSPFRCATLNPVAGVTGAAAVSWKAGTAYSFYLRSVQPIAPVSGETFAPPYTRGRYSAQVAVPTASPAISAVSCDGESVVVEWAPVALPSRPAVAEAAYTLHLLSAEGAELSRVAAGEAGGRASLRADPASGAQVAGSVRFDAIAGPPGAGQAVLTAGPEVETLTLAAKAGSTSITATFAALANQPTGTEVKASLLEDGVLLREASSSAEKPEVSFDLPLSGGHRYELQSRLEVPTGPPKLVGPLGPSVPVLAPAPQVTLAAYDGARLILAWQEGPLAGVVGHRVVLASPAEKKVFEAGPEQLLDVDVELDLSTSWTAAVEPLGAASRWGLASEPQAVSMPPFAPPQVRGMDYDGETLRVDWDAASLPGLSGYAVELAGGAAKTLSVGPETSLALPLAPTEAAGTTVTVTGVAAARATAASATATVVTAAPEITAVAVADEVKVSWNVTTPPAGASYVAELLDGEAVVEVVTASVSEATLKAPAKPGRYSVRGHVAVASVRGPDSAAVPVLTQAPAISFAAALDDVLSLSWAPVSEDGAGGYRVSYEPAAGTQETVETAGTDLALPLPEAGLAAGKVSVTAIGPNTTGPTASAAIVAGYTVDTGSYDGSSLSVELGGTLDPPPAAVWVDVLSEGRVVARKRHDGAPSGALAIPVALPPGAPATVRATGVGQGPITPPSSAVAIPASAPQEVSAVYDGRELHVSWQPVADAGVSGYQVSVAGSTPPVAQIVSGRETATATIAASLAPQLSGATVTVNAVGAAAKDKYLVGPGSAAAPPVLAGFERAIEVPVASQPPYLYRRGAYAALATTSQADVVSYLPKPFVGNDNEVKPEGENEYFGLAKAEAGSGYALTIGKAIWSSFDQSAARTKVRSSYRAFLEAVEAKEVTPWAIPLLRQIIAATMPQTFAETLYYRYGVWRAPNLRAVDLEPGLRLRVSGALWQLAINSPDERNGFIAAGEETYELGATVPPDSSGTGIEPAARSLSVDAFLSLLFPGATQAPAKAVPAAGPLDFFGGTRQTYYRLFYPEAFQGSGGQGSPQISDNVAIVGAPSWTALEAATEEFETKAFNPAASQVFAVYFRGRAALTPLLAATVEGERRWVPVGTTVRQLLASAGLPVWPGGGAGDAVLLQRATANVWDRWFGDPLLRYEPVDLGDAAIEAKQPPLWPLDLPVLGGDEISLAAPAGG